MKKKTRIVQSTSIFLILLITPGITLSFPNSLSEIGQEAAPNPTLESRQLQSENQILQNQKLRREITKLEQETKKLKKETENLEKDFWEKHSSLVTTAASFANTITAIVAILGAFFTIRQQLAETRNEKTRRVDEKFTSIVQDLGSEQPEIKASATVSILTFLEKGYEKYYEQVYSIILANLKLDGQEPTINKLLIKTFEQVIDKYLKNHLITLTEADKKIKLDLSGCHVSGINLSNLSLNQANLSCAKLNNAILEHTILTKANLQNTELTYAFLQGANLNQANLKESIFNSYQNNSKSNQTTEIINSNFEAAILISAKMTKVKIRETNFSLAQLQDVHLNGAELDNVNFRNANLNTVLFKGASFNSVNFENADLQKANFQSAKLDDTTLNSIVQAQNWMQATFDDDIKQKLKDKKLTA